MSLLSDLQKSQNFYIVDHPILPSIAFFRQECVSQIFVEGIPNSKLLPVPNRGRKKSPTYTKITSYVWRKPSQK
jgi:hypothetical protein